MDERKNLMIGAGEIREWFKRRSLNTAGNKGK
jgi:hypothetical protein